MKNNIILIGMMGAGKSSVGKILKEKLSKFSFVDVDEFIEQTNGMTIPEIFEKYAEKGFREIETNAIKDICTRDNQIISTGGGAFEKSENREVLLSSGKVFYLYADYKVLYDRIKTQGNRPMLFCENPQEVFRDLLKKREINYKKADYIIDTTELSVGEVVKEILRRGYETVNTSRDS